MIADLLSVDFVHPDCDEKQMVLHVRMQSGVVVIGPVWVTWKPPIEKSEMDTLNAELDYLRQELGEVKAENSALRRTVRAEKQDD